MYQGSAARARNTSDEPPLVGIVLSAWSHVPYSQVVARGRQIGRQAQARCFLPGIQVNFHLV